MLRSNTQVTKYEFFIIKDQLILFKVKFSFKLGWYYGTGPGCTPNNIGNLTTGGTYDYWRCNSGCGGTPNMNDINYVCTGASIEDLWEQGERDFIYNFTGVGPFTVS